MLNTFDIKVASHIQHIRTSDNSPGSTLSSVLTWESLIVFLWRYQILYWDWHGSWAPEWNQPSKLWLAGIHNFQCVLNKGPLTENVVHFHVKCHSLLKIIQLDYTVNMIIWNHNSSWDYEDFNMSINDAESLRVTKQRQPWVQTSFN